MSCYAKEDYQNSSAAGEFFLDDAANLFRNHSYEAHDAPEIFCREALDCESCTSLSEPTSNKSCDWFYNPVVPLSWCGVADCRMETCGSSCSAVPGAGQSVPDGRSCPAILDSTKTPP